jgi:putative ABC transport system permease protein
MFGEGFRIAFDALLANRIRASLTILGVAIGVSVVVTMAALITGIRSSVMEAVQSSGPENLILTPWDFTDVQVSVGGPGRRPPWWGRPNITEEEVARIAELDAVREAIISFDFNVSMSFQGDRVSGIQGLARSFGWPAYAQGDFIAGRNYTPAEERQARAVVVLTEDLATEMFGSLDPIGKRIRVTSGRRASELFEVIGVFRMEENLFADAAGNWAVFPWSTADKKLQGLGRFNFMSVLVVPEQGFTQSQVQDQIIGALRASRGLGPAEENDFALIRSAQLLDLFDRLTGVFFLVMLALSSVGLMVGGIGVIGIMLISVTERTREIGVRKALGATRREILWQFLVEAGVLTLLGGGIGMALGAAGAELVASFTPIPAKIPLWSIFAALGSALFTGMVFGLLPALRASQLDPVDALRYE